MPKPSLERWTAAVEEAREGWCGLRRGCVSLTTFAAALKRNAQENRGRLNSQVKDQLGSEC